MSQPAIIQQIENLYDDQRTLHEVSRDLPHPLNEVMAFREGIAKYLVDEQWKEIVKLLEQHDIRLQALNLCNNQLKKIFYLQVSPIWNYWILRTILWSFHLLKR